MGLYSKIPGFCGAPWAVGAPRIVTTFHPTSNGPDLGTHLTQQSQDVPIPPTNTNRLLNIFEFVVSIRCLKWFLYCFQVYWVGPMCGGVAAALVYDFLLYPKLDDFPDRMRVLVSGPATDYDVNGDDPPAVEMTSKWYDTLRI